MAKVNFEKQTGRIFCVHCVEEKVERPELGILFSDTDGRGRKPICYGHYKNAVYELTKIDEDHKLAVLGNPITRKIYFEMKEKEGKS